MPPISIERFRVKSASADLACVCFGAGPPLVCVHALAFSKEYFVAAADVLGAQFRCAAFDQRGHGDTDWLGGESTIDPASMARDIEAVLDHLEWDRTVLAGISLGAATTLRFALEHFERVETLIQDLPGFGPTSPRSPGDGGSVADALERGDFEGTLRILTDGMSAARAAALTGAFKSQWDPFGPVLGPKLAAAFRATNRWRIVDDWPAALVGLSVPTHVLGLPGDPSHPFETAKTMAETLPNAQLHLRVPSLSAKAVAAQWMSILGRGPVGSAGRLA
jgi:pimeloyl-ACP methyl ester carboxylesterase